MIWYVLGSSDWYLTSAFNDNVATLRFLIPHLKKKSSLSLKIENKSVEPLSLSRIELGPAKSPRYKRVLLQNCKNCKDDIRPL